MTRTMSTATAFRCTSIVVLTAVVAHSQFVLPNTASTDRGQRVALSATVRTTVSANTPSGAFSQSQEAKYWRSRDGRTRQDTSFGSVIVDGNATTIIHLNHSKKEATVIQMPQGARAPGTAPPPPAGDHVSPTSENLGERQIAGYIARGRRTTTRGDQVLQFGSVVTESWTSAELQLPLSVKQNTSRGQSVQEFDNIAVGEPDASVFTIPSDYTRKESGGSPGPQSWGQPPTKTN